MGADATQSFHTRDRWSGPGFHGYTGFLWVERSGDCQEILVKLDYSEYDVAI